LHKVPRKISLEMNKENQDTANLKEQIRFPGPHSMLGQPEHEAGTLTAGQYHSVNSMTSRRKYWNPWQNISCRIINRNHLPTIYFVELTSP
jgi:hypothetical protein